jgi:hypothetical protein
MKPLGVVPLIKMLVVSMRISRNYKDQHWKALSFDKEADWQEGVAIFMDRMETRYLCISDGSSNIQPAVLQH